MARSTGMYNRIRALNKYCLEVGSKIVHNSECVIPSISMGNAEFFCGVFLCEMSEGQAGWERFIE